MAYLFLIPSILFFIFFTLWPIIKVFKLSFYSTNFITTTFVGLQNYVDSFKDETFLISLKNSISYIGLMVLGEVIASIFFTLLIFKLPKKWQDFSRMFLYIPVLSGGIIISQVWRWVFSNNGIVNWFLGLFGLPVINIFGQGSSAIPTIVFIVITASMGSYIIMLLASALSIDKGILEAATIDGASYSQIKRKILIPLLMPTILLIALLSMIASLQIVENIMMLAPQVYAATPTFSIYLNGFKASKWGMASAQSVILLIITVILSIIKRKIETKDWK